MARFAGDHKLDPRERSAEFHSLPEQVRTLRREGWHEHAEWQAGIEQRDREFLLEDTITGAVLLGLASLLFMNAALAPVLVGIVAGALAGALGSIVRAGTITTLCLGIPAGLLVLQYGLVSGRSAMLLMLSVCIGCIMIAQHRILRTT